MISVIIPVVNEAERLPGLLQALAGQRGESEVIVVDGGSEDGSADRARRAGVRLITAPRGRGQQLRAGAAGASGSVLWFLHADSEVPPGALSAIQAGLDRAPEAVGGNFRLEFDGDDDFSRWLTGFYAWLRRRGVYYGDSGVFVRRDAYAALGGIPPLALMEDYLFNRRLQRLGPTLCLQTPALITSSRRFRQRHPAAIVAGWLVVHALFHLGVDPARLARLYRSDRRHAG